MGGGRKERGREDAKMADIAGRERRHRRVSAQTSTLTSANSSTDALCGWISKGGNVEKSMKGSNCKRLPEYKKNKKGEREREI